MEIYYGKDGRDFWQSSKLLTRKYGAENAKKIQRRIMEMQASPSFADLPPAARPHPLIGDHKGCFSLHIQQPFRLIVEPYGDFDLACISTIKSVTILTVTDYH